MITVTVQDLGYTAQYVEIVPTHITCIYPRKLGYTIELDNGRSVEVHKADGDMVREVLHGL